MTLTEKLNHIKIIGQASTTSSSVIKPPYYNNLAIKHLSSIPRYKLNPPNTVMKEEIKELITQLQKTTINTLADKGKRVESQATEYTNDQSDSDNEQLNVTKLERAFIDPQPTMQVNMAKYAELYLLKNYYKRPSPVDLLYEENLYMSK